MVNSCAWILVALLGGVFFWWLLALVVFPLGELFFNLRRIASGDFRPVILGATPVFFRRVADDLRRTAELLASQKELIAEEEFSLSIILESMTEGVVVTGSDLRIRLMNRSESTRLNSSH